MNEIMKKTYELVDVLEESEIIRDIERYRDRIRENGELCSLIRQGNQEVDEYALLDIKRKLYKNKDYKGYMDQYNQLMHIVMDINYRYHKLLGKGGCYR